MPFNSPEVRAHSSGNSPRLPNIGYKLQHSFSKSRENRVLLESKLHSPIVRRQFSNPGEKEKQNCLLLVTTPVSESKNKYKLTSVLQHSSGIQKTAICYTASFGIKQQF
jgi:hypothetical protein